MLSPDDIQQLCERKYPAFLRSVVTGERFFPMPIRFGRPSTADDWETLRREISSLSNARLGYHIEWTETNTRRWGRQKFPERVWFESESEFVNTLRKAVEVDEFRKNLALIRKECAALEGWLTGNVSKIIEFGAVWTDLLKVCSYFLGNPRPGLYSRELPIDVDTKFVERHQAILRSVLDFLLPKETGTIGERFEERFGLRFDEPSIRFRILDEALTQRFGFRLDDVATPLSQFQRLNWKSLRIVVAENKMTFLTLPPLPNAVGIWGGGVAAELLTSVPWLGHCELIYWGDIDVHGFHILARLRNAFPNTRSLMMDSATFEQFHRVAVEAKASAYERIEELTDDERKLYFAVRDGKILLEQEKIPIDYVRGQFGPFAGSQDKSLKLDHGIHV